MKHLFLSTLLLITPFHIHSADDNLITQQPTLSDTERTLYIMHGIYATVDPLQEKSKCAWVSVNGCKLLCYPYAAVLASSTIMKASGFYHDDPLARNSFTAILDFTLLESSRRVEDWYFGRQKTEMVKKKN